MNLFGLLQQTAKRYGDHPAVFSGPSQVLTYAQWEADALRLSRGLLQLGQPGDRVLLASRNCPEILVLMFAVWAAGMTFAPVNAKLHPNEIDAIIVDADARIIVADQEIANSLWVAGDEERHIVSIDGEDYRKLFDAQPGEAVDVDAASTAWIFYTSGTTGKSKGAMLSHRCLRAVIAAHLADFEDLSADHSIIHAAPLSHGTGICVLPYVARGSRHVVPASAGFKEAEFLELCRVHPGCGAFLVPTMVQRLRIELERSDCRSHGLRSLIFGGGPMYIDELRRALDCFGPILRHLYGQGEAPMTIAGIREVDFADRSEALMNSVGWPRTGVEVRIVDEDDQELPAGEIGEVVCRGDIMMSGYWRDPEASASALRGGWLHTGDLGSVDDRGRLVLRGRSKDLIISGGTNIYAKEVEDVLMTHPAVLEAAVVGQKDVEWGETIVAFVVTHQDHIVSSQDLEQHCLRSISRFKRPKDYLFVSELPKSDYGKVLKRRLTQMLEQGALVA